MEQRSQVRNSRVNTGSMKKKQGGKGGGRRATVERICKACVACVGVYMCICACVCTRARVCVCVCVRGGERERARARERERLCLCVCMCANSHAWSRPHSMHTRYAHARARTLSPKGAHTHTICPLRSRTHTPGHCHG